MTKEVNSGLLSDCRDVGRTNWGMILLRRMLETVETLLLVVGKASTHQVKVSTRTRRNLCFFTGGMWVKSICQSEPGRYPLAWWQGKVGLWDGVLGLAFWHMSHDVERSFRNLRSPGERLRNGFR